MKINKNKFSGSGFGWGVKDVIILQKYIRSFLNGKTSFLPHSDNRRNLLLKLDAKNTAKAVKKGIKKKLIEM